MNDNKQLPEYENPPIVEVVCGVTFDEIPALTAAPVGIFWQVLQPDFPRIQELPPLGPTVEIFDGEKKEIEMKFSSIPSLPREMFYSNDENRVIQIQRDRFIYNWRKFRPDDSYPRFTKVYDSFTKRFNQFKRLMEGTPFLFNPIQYELTYINQITFGDFGQDIKGIGGLMPALNLSFENNELLKEPENFNFRVNFLLPNRIGRLYVVARSGTFNADKTPVILLELRVRGLPDDLSEQARDEWFQTAREWVVKGFGELICKDIQNQVWRRKQ